MPRWPAAGGCGNWPSPPARPTPRWAGSPASTSAGTTRSSGQLADKPVDPGTEVPLAFLTFDLVSPLFAETRRPVREFALELAKYEFARWNPTIDQLVAMTELPFADVRRFVAKALLADDAPENRLFRLDPAKLEPRPRTGSASRPTTRPGLWAWS